MHSTALESRCQMSPVPFAATGVVNLRTARARRLLRRTDGDQRANGCEYLSNGGALGHLTAAWTTLPLLSPETVRKRIHGKASPHECVGQEVQ